MDYASKQHGPEIGLFRIIPLNSRACLDVTERAKHGAIAQLGERLHGMQEVVGSIPTSSTRIPPELLGSPRTLKVARPHRLEA